MNLEIAPERQNQLSAPPRDARDTKQVQRSRVPDWEKHWQAASVPVHADEINAHDLLMQRCLHWAEGETENQPLQQRTAVA